MDFGRLGLNPLAERADGEFWGLVPAILCCHSGVIVRMTYTTTST
jgi:hypothetical protein